MTGRMWVRTVDGDAVAVDQTARLRSAFDAFDAFAAWLDSLAGEDRPGEAS